MNELISVVIPVYNMEAYLEYAIDSICNQIYSNLQIILVDDGSTDSSPAICDRYATLDSRILVLHTENGGVSSARNTGMEAASGEYLAFLDSDDFVSPHYISNLYTTLQHTGADLALSNWTYVRDHAAQSASPVREADMVYLTSKEVICQFLTQELRFTAWGNLCRRTLWNGIRFPVGKLYEDIIACYRLVQKCSTIVKIPNKDYCYFVRSGSITQSRFQPRHMDGVEHMDQIIEDVLVKYPQMEPACQSAAFHRAVLTVLMMEPDDHSHYRDILWDRICKTRMPALRNRTTIPRDKVLALFSFLGFPLMLRLYRVYRKFAYGSSKIR